MTTHRKPPPDRGRRALGPAAAALGIFLLFLAPALAADKVEFKRDIRPILTENCLPCHGPDPKARKAEMRLDQRDSALKKGAIVPGKPEESKIVKRIFSSDADEVMPPPASRKKLSPEQKELLKRWIAAGAEYQIHWSFIPPKRPESPAVKNAAWVRNPIDRFVLAKLEEHGLEPAPEADRRTLDRRLSLDLTGLPSAPADVEAFVNDPSGEAYEKFAERLLASASWGEHRARYWLDAARYADTHGIHFDNFREIWAYRDWVIGAFNHNLPFDQFTIEQLAGDLLPDRTPDQLIASGFNRCNITTNEGGVIPEEYLVLYTRDRTETVSQVWLGLTANCSVCHNHKFDPITQREFYQMAAFFNNTTQGAMDGNIKDTPPVVPVPQPEDRARWDALAAEIPASRQRLEARRQAARADFDRWLAALRPESVAAQVPAEGLKLHAPMSEGSGSAVLVAVEGRRREVSVGEGAIWEAGHVAAKAFKAARPGSGFEVAEAGDFDKDQPFSCGAWIKVDKKGASGAIVARMDDSHGFRGWDLWLNNGSLGSHLIHQWSEDAIKVVSRTPLKTGEWTHVFVTYDGSAKAEGVKLYANGQPQETNVEANSLKQTIRTEVPFKVAQRHQESRLDGLSIQDVRLFGRALPPAETAQVARATRAAWLAAKAAGERTEEEKKELFEWWLPALDKEYAELAARAAALEGEQNAIKGRGTVAHVMQERAEAPGAFILFRGEYDKRRDPVVPGTPDFLPPMPPELPKNRLGFAQWLLRPEHPLTARVTANRFWQEVFGAGLVRTAGDFGASGELPSHPELLDWLAVELRESCWNVKGFFKLLVTSATYRQAAIATPEKLEQDPQNRLWSRGPRFRMDAEMVRDYALAASGLLAPRIGGPSVKPYQPDGVWEAVAMIGSNTRDYVRDRGESLYRRSLYTLWKRAAPPASMDIFNAPNRETCAVRRERTNTPLQALVTLNDPQFVEAARHLAELALQQSGGSFENRFDLMARRLVARPFRPEEIEVARAALDDLLEYYRSHAEDAAALISTGESKPDPKLDPAALAAWTLLANQLLNLDEVLNK